MRSWTGYLKQVSAVLWRWREKLVILVLVVALVMSRQAGPVFVETPAPYRAQPIKILKEVQTIVEEIQVPVFYPSPKELDKIQDRIGGELPPGEKILQVVRIDPLPSGGHVSVTAGQSGVSVTVFPSKPSFFEWNWKDRSIAAWSEVTTPSLDVEYHQGIARVGRVSIEGRVVADRLLEEARDVRVQIGARVSF